MSESNFDNAVIRAGDRVLHAARDSKAWHGRVLLVQSPDPRHEQVALVEIDGETWTKWRLVPLRTIAKEPPKCDSIYVIAGEKGMSWTSVSCDLTGHARTVRHHAVVGPNGDSAEVFWNGA